MAAPMCKSWTVIQFLINGKSPTRILGLSWCRKVHYLQKCQMSSTTYEQPHSDIPLKDSIPTMEVSDIPLKDSIPTMEVCDIPLKDSIPTMEEFYNDEFDIERAIKKTPKEHYDNLKKNPDHPIDAKILKLAVIGIPNAGKSTLINRLMGLKVSSVSNKVHTTRKNTNAVLTEDNNQIVFVDTPGLINPSSRKRHNVEKRLVYNPELGVQSADLVAVIVDAADKWTRDCLDKKVLQVLQIHKDTPSILVLNKIDAMKSKIMLLHITRLLIEGIVGGKKIEFSTRAMKRDRKNFDVKAYLNKIDESIAQGEGKENEKALPTDNVNFDLHTNYNTPVISLHERSKEKLERQEDLDKQPESNQDLNSIKQRSDNIPEEQRLYTDYLSRMQEVAKDIRDQTGWPHFDKVFMISALEDDGITELKNYLLQQTRPGDWVYHSSVVVDEDPMDVAKEIVWEKLMEHLPKGPVPYKLSPELVLWEVDEDGVLNIIMDVRAHDAFQYRCIIGSNASVIRKITQEAKQELLNAFRCEMRFKLQIKYGRQK